MEISHVKRNVDEADIKKFNSMAADWWDLKGSQHGLHDMNNVRVPFVIDGLLSTNIIKKEVYDEPNVLEGINILDVGCGGGILAEALGRKKATVVGLDAAKDLIDLARDHLYSQEDIINNVSYVCETMEEHCMKHSNKYDAVVCSEVLEHILDKKSFLEACVKALKPGGSIFITTPSKAFVSWFFTYLCGEKIFRVIKSGTHDFNLFTKPSDVEKILDEFNCKTILVRGMRYDFWRSQKWRFQQAKNFSYALQAVKI